MIGLVLIFVGSLGLSSAICYAWWSYCRTIFFRQRLFSIRAELWSDAHALVALSDPGYVQSRDRLNVFIRVAETFNLKTISYISKNHLEGGSSEITCNDSKVQAVVDSANRKAIEQVLIFMLLHRLSGWLFLIRSALETITKNSSAKVLLLYRDLLKWLRSDGPSNLSELRKSIT